MCYPGRRNSCDGCCNSDEINQTVHVRIHVMHVTISVNGVD